MAEATRQFEQVVDRFRQQHAGALVVAAYLEFAAPGVQQAIAQLAEAGVRDIVILPCLLFVGKHLQRDIPELIAALQAARPELRIRAGRPIGPDPRIVDILHDRLEELA